MPRFKNTVSRSQACGTMHHVMLWGPDWIAVALHYYYPPPSRSCMMDDGSSTACLPACREHLHGRRTKPAVLSVCVCRCCICIALHCMPLSFISWFTRAWSISIESYGKRAGAHRPTDRPISIEDDEGHISRRQASIGFHACCCRLSPLLRSKTNRPDHACGGRAGY